MNWLFDDPVPMIDLIDRWPNQTFAVAAVAAAIAGGKRRVLVTGPTGSGKSLIMTDVALNAVRGGNGVALFAHRKLLIEQMTKNLRTYGVGYGVRAANHPPDPAEPFQVCSIQTEYSRVCKRRAWTHHESALYVVDEAHLMENKTAQAVYDEYDRHGCVKVGFTATPLGLDGCYDVLIQAGTTGELREYGALVLATHFGCTEPDMKNIRRYSIGEELSENDNVKAIMVPGIHGRVLEWYRRLNPQGLPAIGFAPGVPESLGFAEAFEDAGIPAAHIDGDRIWIRGTEYPSTEAKRAELLEMSRTGAVRVVWNRFVLREAIDMPWLQHGIFACVFGTVSTFLQAGGRLLRACPPAAKTGVTIQDHGGNWWRHGSLNSDRVWSLSDTDAVVAQLRRDALTGDGNDGIPTEPHPFLCRRCQGAILVRGILRDPVVRCPHCGFEFDFRRRSRPVVQSDGSLVEHPGNVFVARKVERRHDTHKLWEKTYWRARKTGTMTFGQAAGLFYKDNGYTPPRNLPFMPFDNTDWYRPVGTVPFQRLRPREDDE